MPGVLWALFWSGIAVALFWIGIGDVRGQRRPSWLVRLAIYCCIFAILAPMAQVAREAIVKERVIRNLKNLGEAVRQYEATYKIRPSPSNPPLGATPSDRSGVE